VHDTCVIEHNINAPPGIKVVDQGLDIGFFGNITNLDLLMLCLMGGRRGIILELQPYEPMGPIASTWQMLSQEQVLRYQP